MSYRRALLTRWSRRDRLAVVVVAAVTLLLVGTTVAVAAANAETTRIIRSVDDNGVVVAYDDPAVARAAAPPSAVVLPAASVTVDDRQAMVVGIPPNATGYENISLPSAPPPGGVLGPGNSIVRLIGYAGTVERFVRPRTTDGVIPGWWYVARPRTVAELGSTRALVIYPNADGVTPSRGVSVPLVGVPTFFVVGIEGVFRSLFAVGVGAGVLVGVVVYSVTRMTVQDRRETIAVLRATGLEPRRVLELFVGRALLLSVVGVVAGYTAGVIVPNAVVSAAVALGVPTTLSLRVTATAVRIVGPILLGLVAIAGVSAALATLPAVRVPPTAVARRHETSPHGRWRSMVSGVLADEWSQSIVPGASVVNQCRSVVSKAVTPQVLTSVSAVPTTATLSVFVAMVLVAAALGGTLAPLANADERAIVQEGAAHPVVSRVDTDYARLLRDSGRPASPEILAFSAIDGQVFLTRGANYSAFAAVTDARLVAGRVPRAPGEAVIGTDLAAQLDMSLHETLVLGGSTRPAVAYVRIVGIYRAPGLYDDQLIVPLRTARHLTHVGPDQVNLIRVAGGPNQARDSSTATRTEGARLLVRGIDSPASVVTGDRFAVTLTVQNTGDTAKSKRFTLRFDGRTRTHKVTVPAGATKRVTFRLRAPPPGVYTLRVANTTTSVKVARRGVLRLPRLPSRGPPNASMRVSVVDDRGTPVANVTVTIDTRTLSTGPNGTAVVRLPPPGRYTVTASKPGFANASREFLVRKGARRRLLGSVTVAPTRPTTGRRPTATVALYNLWGQPVTRRVVITGPVTETVVLVTVSPGARRTITATLARTGPGRHRVTARVDGRVLDRAMYRVQGTQRLVGVVAATGAYDTATASAFGQAVTHVVGNIEVLVVMLVLLTALVTVSSIVAVFARAVHARQRTLTIYRATGATSRQVVALVLADVIRLATPATVLALSIGYAGIRAMTALGAFSAFGVKLHPPVSVPLFAGIAVGALALSVGGAVAATVPMLRVPPAQSFETAPEWTGLGGDDG